MIRRHYLDSRYGQIHLRACGDGPLLLLAHANPWTSLFWEPVMPHFAAAGFRAIAWDGLCYGNSDHHPAGLTVEGQTDVLVDIVPHLGGEVAAVIGWHQGAIVGLDFALRQPEHCPALVLDGATTATDDQAMDLARTVLAYNPDYPFAGREGHWWIDMLLGKLRLFNPHFKLDAETWPFFRRFVVGSLQNDPSIATSPSPMVPEAVRRALTPHKNSPQDIPYYDWLGALSRLESALLILSAEEEPLWPAHAHAVAAAPAGHAEHVYGGGHPLIGVGREAEYVAPIVDFLRARQSNGAAAAAPAVAS